MIVSDQKVTDLFSIVLGAFFSSEAFLYCFNAVRSKSGGNPACVVRCFKKETPPTNPQHHRGRNNKPRATTAVSRRWAAQIKGEAKQSWSPRTIARLPVSRGGLLLLLQNLLSQELVSQDALLLRAKIPHNRWKVLYFANDSGYRVHATRRSKLNREIATQSTNKGVNHVNTAFIRCMPSMQP